MARPVVAAAISIAAGKSKDAKLLRRYALESPTEARPLLEEACRLGAPRVQEAGFLSLAQLDLSRAEALALAAAAVGAGLSRKAARRAALKPLLWVATPACLSEAERLGVPFSADDLHDEARARALAHLVPRLRTLPPAEQLAAFTTWFGDGEALDVDALAPMLDDALTHAPLRLHIATSLVQRGHAPTCRRDDLPSVLQARALFVLPPDEAFDRARRLLEARPSARVEVLEALLHAEQVDPRWVPLVESFSSEALRLKGLLATRRPEAMRSLTPLLLAMPFGPELLTSLAALRQFDTPDAAPPLLHWLARRECDGHAALLATSLRACAGPDAIGALEAAMARNPAGTPFYAEAIATIRARTEGA
ncbi:MAG: hypothetical protein MUC96_24020 [Myxococcaceae bacterium]|jgi:hypothetical protein|nr:hypothetical protein [Myxococcaceae bacterium]